MRSGPYYHGTVHANHPVFAQQPMRTLLSNSQHSIGPGDTLSPGFSHEQQLYHGSTTNLPGPITHVPGHYPNGYGPATLPQSALPVRMTRSQSQVYQSVYAHNSSERRRYTYSPGVKPKIMSHQHLPSYQEDTNPPEAPQHIHRSQYSGFSHQLQDVQVHPLTDDRGQFQVSTGSTQSTITSSTEKVQDSEKSPFQSTPTDRLQSAARHNAVPVLYSNGQSDSNEGHTDAESREAEHTLEKSGDECYSTEESLEHPLDPGVKESYRENSVDRAKDIHHSTPTLGMSKNYGSKTLPYYNETGRPSSAIAGKPPNTVTTTPRNLKPKDKTFTSSLPAICSQPEVKQGK